MSDVQNPDGSRPHDERPHGERPKAERPHDELPNDERSHDAHPNDSEQFSVPEGLGEKDDTVTQRYLDLVQSVHDEWARLEEEGDDSVQLSAAALSTIKEAVRADARHGARVEMPPTPVGPYTLSELSLRTLVRDAVDSVPGAVALRSVFEFATSSTDPRARGVPVRVRCRMSASSDTKDLLQLAEDVRTAVVEVFREEVALFDTIVDVHIEDLHAQ